MLPVRRHRIGNQFPAVIHPLPDPAAINFCRDLVAETDVGGAILFGSLYTGGWDEQSDLDLIIVHTSAHGDEDRTALSGPGRAQGTPLPGPPGLLKSSSRGEGWTDG